MAAIIVLALHLAIIAFNLAGCVLMPLGAWLGWRWVRGFRWRLAHLLSLAVVAVQAMPETGVRVHFIGLQSDG